MNTTFTLLFFLRKNKPQPDKSVPIYLRITIEGKRADISTKRYIQIDKWKHAEQKMAGTSEDVKAFNNYLKTFENKIYDAHRSLMEGGKSISAEILKNKVLGISDKPRYLLEIFEQHNKNVEQLIGHGYAVGTLRKYRTTKSHIQNFLKWKFRTSDFNIKELNYEFIADFEFYLASQLKMDVNTICKYLKNFKKVIKECVVKGWIDKEPFLGFKVKSKPSERPFLLQYELNAIEERVFSTERINLVKDIFIFSCYTGLAYQDVANLTAENMAIGIDGEKWIFTHRQKTETASRIPLLPPALAIIEKYKNHPKALNKGRLLPIASNQKMNAYLKEIADLCEIHKELTFHCARHTFATTVTLSNGIPIETVSKMLGHKKINTTQIYAKIIDKKVSDDMQLLRSKFTGSLKVIALEKTGS